MSTDLKGFKLLNDCLPPLSKPTSSFYQYKVGEKVNVFCCLADSKRRNEWRVGTVENVTSKGVTVYIYLNEDEQYAKVITDPEYIEKWSE